MKRILVTIKNRDYLLYEPEDISRLKGMVLFMPGKGQRGDNIAKIEETGLPRDLAPNLGGHESDYAVLGVQIPTSKSGYWRGDVYTWDDWLKARYPQFEKTHLTGLSLGGIATGQAMNWPETRERFATYGIVSGWLPALNTKMKIEELDKYRGMRVKVWHDADDPTVGGARNYGSFGHLLARLKGDIDLTIEIYERTAHAAWNKAYPDSYFDFLDGKEGISDYQRGFEAGTEEGKYIGRVQKSGEIRDILNLEI